MIVKIKTFFYVIMMKIRLIFDDSKKIWKEENEKRKSESSGKDGNTLSITEDRFRVTFEVKDSVRYVFDETFCMHELDKKDAGTSDLVIEAMMLIKKFDCIYIEYTKTRHGYIKKFRVPRWVMNVSSATNLPVFSYAEMTEVIKEIIDKIEHAERE